MSQAAERIAIGRVVRPQGRHGEVLAEPLSDRPERFPTLRRVLVGMPGAAAEEMTVAGCWPHKGRFVLKLVGVDSIDAAERLRGRELSIPEADLAPLPPGSYYHHDLVGLLALDESGRELGRVRGILETGAAPVIEIAGPGGELLVPLATPFVAAVDLKARTLTLVAPEDVAVH